MVSSYLFPPQLSTIAANVVSRCLVYEDFIDCDFYRWDPVKIWQFEPPQPKKKGKKKNDIVITEDSCYNHPPPPWRELKKFRDWWQRNDYLGSINSSVRSYIVDAFEQLSWTSSSEEEDVLFFLIRLCTDTQINIGYDFANQIPQTWTAELILILEKLGPFPLQKMIVTKDIFGNKAIISTILQNSPKLQILRIGQWELNNDILLTLGNHCSALQEFTIPSMKPDVFMSDTAFFRCFFGGMSTAAVLCCYKQNENPKKSFPNLRHIDILYCKQTERFLQMICSFYPNVTFNGVDLTLDLNIEETMHPFKESGASLNSIGISLKTQNILNDSLPPMLKIIPSLCEIRIFADDNFPGADLDSQFRRQIENASVKLKNLIKSQNKINTLILRPHEAVELPRIILPTLYEYGKHVLNLQFVYDFSPINTNTLYQLINQCPFLQQLAISLNILEEDTASDLYKAKLNTCHSLDSLVIMNLVPRDEPPEVISDNIAIIKIAYDILKASPNLINFGISCQEAVYQQFFILESSSVKRIHLQFSSIEELICEDYEYEKDSNSMAFTHHFFNTFVPKFPSVKVVSIEDPKEKIWEESLRLLSKTGCKFTRKSPEFFSCYKWPDYSTTSYDAMNFVVM